MTAGNDRAERLYARHGFVATGRTTVRERDGRTEIEMEHVEIGQPVTP